jgi:hypothetical protein
MESAFKDIPARQTVGAIKQGGSAQDAFATLRRFARSRAEIERCELCSDGLGTEHSHLLNRQSRKIVCSCEACAILFCGQENTKFRRIPRRIIQLGSFTFDALSWEALMLPINLAFFLREPNGKTSVLYPSPAGATSSLLDLTAWDTLFSGETILATLEPEVEALLVNRMGRQAIHFVVPIDECYRLVGLIRTRWHGLSGGTELWQAVTDFFSSLEKRAIRIGGASRA